MESKEERKSIRFGNPITLSFDNPVIATEYYSDVIVEVWIVCLIHCILNLLWLIRSVISESSYLHERVLYACLIAIFIIFQVVFEILISRSKAYCFLRGILFTLGAQFSFLMIEADSPTEGTRYLELLFVIWILFVEVASVSLFIFAILANVVTFGLNIAFYLIFNSDKDILSNNLLNILNSIKSNEDLLYNICFNITKCSVLYN